MTLPLLILRPIEGALKTAAKAKIDGLSPIADPLFEIRAVNWNASPADQYDAIMFTSANAIKMAGPGLAKYLGLPVLAVGEVTAQAAVAAGFRVVAIGKDGVQALVNTLAAARFSRILRLSGEDYTPVQSDRNIETIGVYQSAVIGLGDDAVQSLNDGCVTLLHSTRAAHVLVNQMDKAGIARHNNHIIAISPAVAKAAGTDWNSINVADKPTDEALLSLAARLCSGETDLRSPNEPGL